VSVMTANPFEPEKDTALWTVAALLVVALHVGIAAAYLLLRPAPGERAEAPVVDVAFMPAETMPAPAAPEALPAEPTPPVERSSIEPPKDEPAPQPEPPPPPVALATPEPPSADQLTVMPPPPPKPVEAAPEPKKPVAPPEHTARKPARDEKAEKEKEEKHKVAQAKPAAAPGSKPTRVALAPNPGADSEGAREGRASWKSEVLARIRRSATYTPNGSSGTAQISFTVDRNGRLVSRRIAASSGSSALDSAAMSVLGRAQPFPHFPAGMTEAQITLTVPLHLNP
jgi:periplasmic protein TonB